MSSRDDQQKLRVLTEDAERGIARAQRLLALRFLRGRGVPRDLGLGLEWLRRAAEQGHPQAQRDLGEFLERGEGLPRNDAEARRLYRLAAHQGDPIALNHLRRLGLAAGETG